MGTKAVSRGKRARGRLSRWYHDMSLRSRLAVLASVAVAVAIAMCSVACWFIVRDQTYALQQQTLATAPIPHNLPP